MSRKDDVKSKDSSHESVILSKKPKQAKKKFKNPKKSPLYCHNSPHLGKNLIKCHDNFKFISSYK